MANILIADRSKTIRRILSKAFTDMRHNIAEASSGSEAMELMKKDIFDIAIIDLQIEEVSGIDVLKAFREISPDTDIIVTTSYASVVMAVEAMKLGAYDFVTKPINMEELTLIISRILENQELAENVKMLKTRVEQKHKFPNIVGDNKAMLKVFDLINRVCQFDTAVFITGESGTGKELVAQAIHFNSPRKDKPFVPVNCAALPENIQESELFGHTEGAFTDASTERKGLFEEADGGTLFLDEIADASLLTQAKLLRFLENGEIRKIGDNLSVRVDVRLIAATNKDLQKAIERDEFREDLYYRINVIEINLPPLRERKDDLPLLVQYFLERFSSKAKKDITSLSRDTFSILMNYDWPGNIRELQNAIQHAVAVTQEEVIQPSSLPAHILTNGSDKFQKENKNQATLEELKLNYMHQILEKNSMNYTKSAEILGIGRATLYRKMKDYIVENP
ncbi:response regulator [Candidatus Poribacteria bacterium]|nr:response regulator [Candidatus Poribacteria bacterium]